MRCSTPFWRLAPGAALILFYTGSSMALTLGRAQGVAAVGRPLDVTIQASLDGVRDGELCADADVFYGDTRMESRRVELQQSGNIARLRVRVAMPVNEPFVTIDARVGCNERLTRNYVLLAESPVEVAQAAAQPAPPPPVAVVPPAPARSEPVTRPVDAGQVAPAPAAPAAPAARAARPPVRPSRSEAAAPVGPAPARRVARAPAVPAPAAPAAPKVERPRLKLDAAEIASSPAGLKTTPSLQSLPAASSPQRAEAAAQWQALSAQPDDLLRTSQRMQSLEGDIKAMREAMLKNNAMLTDLRGRLEQAERERYSNGLVYALAGLLAAASALAAFLWHRGRRSHPANSSWWMDRAEGGQAQLRQDEPVLAPPAPAPAAARATAAATAAALAGTTAAGAVMAARPAAAAPVAAPSTPVAAGATASPRVSRPAGIEGRVSDDAIKLDELSDIQQQADFFVSLGEHDRAIGVLRNHIDAHPQGSAVAWLDLLDIYHRLRREDDYEQLRRDFEWLFNAKVPSYAEYHEDNSGLEMQPGRLSQIQSLWGTPEVLDVINDAVLRRPVQDEGEPLGLEAYRDLLMLHDIASDLQAEGPQDGPIEPAAAVAAPPAVVTLSAPAATGPRQSTQWDELGTGVRELELAPSEFDRLMPASARRASPPPAPVVPVPAAAPVAMQDLDLNLDELQVPVLPPEAPAPAPAASSAHDGNLLDFDLDLNEEFKKPGDKS